MKHKHCLRSLLFLMLCIAWTQGIAQKQGQEKIDSLLNELKNYKPACKQLCLKDSVKVKLLNLLAIELRSQNPDTAILLSQQSLQIAEKINWQKGIGQSNSQLGLFHQMVGEYPKALGYISNALKIWQNLEKNASVEMLKFIINRKAAAYSNQGMVYSDQGLFVEAEKSHNMAIQLYDSIGDKNGSATPLLNLGYLYKKKGYYSFALDKYYRALKIFEESENKVGIANTHYNIGGIQRTQGKYEKALYHFNQAQKIADENDLRSIYYSSTFQIGNTYFDRKDYENAKSYYSKAIAFDKSFKNPQLYNAILIQIGAVYKATGDLPNALHYINMGLRGCDSIGDVYNVMISKNQLGEIYEAKGNDQLAEKYYKESLSMANERNSMEDQEDANMNLFKLFKKKGDYKTAISFFEAAAIAKDSLSNAAQKDLIKIELQYEFDKKENEMKTENERKVTAKNIELKKQKFITYSFAGGAGIIGLSFLSFFFYKRKSDAEQKQKETLLSLQVSETEMKALRSQMNPHFIFNALQSIQTFLLSNKSEDANNYLLKFSKLMRLVLENSQHSEISLKDDMQALELYMQLESIRLPHPFTYQFHIDESVDVETDSLPPLILQPFVENAIWHGLQYKPEPGHINIFITKKDNALHSTVEDNGVGRDMSKQVAQPMLLKKESLGMKLTEERLKILNELKKIKAQFQIVDIFTKDNKPAGTRVELSLPVVT